MYISCTSTCVHLHTMHEYACAYPEISTNVRSLTICISTYTYIHFMQQYIRRFGSNKLRGSREFSQVRYKFTEFQLPEAQMLNHKKC